MQYEHRVKAPRHCDNCGVHIYCHGSECHPVDLAVRSLQQKEQAEKNKMAMSYDESAEQMTARVKMQIERLYSENSKNLPDLQTKLVEIHSFLQGIMYAVDQQVRQR